MNPMETLLVVVAMKPLEGTFAQNAIQHGVAGLAIDACRVGTEKVITTCGKGFDGSFGGGRNDNGGAVRFGRWPANLILVHGDCKCRGTKKVKGDGHHSYKLPEDGGLYRLGLKDMEDRGNPYADIDGKETVPDMDCVDGCPAKVLNKQSGELKSGMMQPGQKRKATLGGGGYHGNMPDEATYNGTYGDSGGASRFFKEV